MKKGVVQILVFTLIMGSFASAGYAGLFGLLFGAETGAVVTEEGCLSTQVIRLNSGTSVSYDGKMVTLVDVNPSNSADVSVDGITVVVEVGFPEIINGIQVSVASVETTADGLGRAWLNLVSTTNACPAEQGRTGRDQSTCLRDCQVKCGVGTSRVVVANKSLSATSPSVQKVGFFRRLFGRP